MVTPNGIERVFEPHEVIVSKTDPKGIITYANRVFCKVAGYEERELLGKPHNIIRHPDMPRGAFKLLWDRLAGGHEVFAIVLNLARDGYHYWVLAHVTPSYAPDGTLVGYHSNRRLPPREMIAALQPIYKQMLDLEATIPNPKQAAQASCNHLLGLLDSLGTDYDRFFFHTLGGILDRELAARA
ncbi:MAG: PAS domain-containing protein [Vulcanimicrobiota bacterium]